MANKPTRNMAENQSSMTNYN